MSLVEKLAENSTVINSKGGEYYDTTYSANLDMFCMIARKMSDEKIRRFFCNAYAENKQLALANLLFILDIRDGKGERKIFKTCYKWLCVNDKESAIKIMNLIGELGRFDYLLVGLKTEIHKETIKLIETQLLEDSQTEYPSLLAKWLPTRRRKNDELNYTRILCEDLKLTREQYRKTLSSIRKKLNLIETKLANKDYKIEFDKVPTKAMLKYKQAFQRNCSEAYSEYITKASKGEVKINTQGLFAYEIVKNIYKKSVRYMTKDERNLYNAMWEQQKNILKGCDKNVLVMADTSGSMTWDTGLPIYSSIGLAIYIAERNTGAFKDYFMTFSSSPKLQKITGIDIVDKIKNINCINDNTNIDKAFQLLLDTAIENNIPQEEMPSHIVIISDMEFDRGVYSENSTNLNGWKKAFDDYEYTLPKIIFWNVSETINGMPATKFSNDVAMISGFSTAIFENILNIENITPINIMLEKLKKYLEMLGGRND